MRSSYDSSPVSETALTGPTAALIADQAPSVISVFVWGLKQGRALTTRDLVEGLGLGRSTAQLALQRLARLGLVVPTRVSRGRLGWERTWRFLARPAGGAR